MTNVAARSPKRSKSGHRRSISISTAGPPGPPPPSNQARELLDLRLWKSRPEV